MNRFGVFAVGARPREPVRDLRHAVPLLKFAWIGESLDADGGTWRSEGERRTEGISNLKISNFK
jgi:hypothetical protein